MDKLSDSPRPRRLARLALKLAAGLIALVALAAAGVWGLAEWKLRHRQPVEAVALAIAPSPALAAEGRRAFHYFGCFECHGEAGTVLFEEPGVGRLTASNISRLAPAYSDAELARLIRRGVKRDGSTAIVMPARTMQHMADEDAAAIIAYVRTLPQKPDAAPPTRLGPLGVIGVAADKVPLSAPSADGKVTPPVRRPTGVEGGGYFARAICLDCHDMDAAKDDGFGMVTPPLRAMVQAYSAEEFHTLLKTGKAIGNREVGAMSSVARKGFSSFTDGEIEAIRLYLSKP